MHQTPWSPERPLPPPVSLTSQSHHEKPPEVTCTSRGKPGFPAATRERPRETFFNTSRGQVPLPGLESNDALPLAQGDPFLQRLAFTSVFSDAIREFVRDPRFAPILG